VTWNHFVKAAESSLYGPIEVEHPKIFENLIHSHNFLNLTKNFIQSYLLQFDNKIWELPSSFLSYKCKQCKIRVFLVWHIIAIVTCYWLKGWPQLVHQCLGICMIPGAVIGDGDRKRALFLVLGLSLWYGTILLFLEQIVPSSPAHARACYEVFADAARRKWRGKFPKNFECFWPTTQYVYGILLQYLRRSLYLTDQVVFRSFFYKSSTLLHSKFHIFWRWTAFP